MKETLWKYKSEVPAAKNKKKAFFFRLMSAAKNLN